MPEDVESAEDRGDTDSYTVLTQFECVKTLIPETITTERAIQRTTAEATEARGLANRAMSMLPGPFSRGDLLENMVRDLTNTAHLFGNVD